jgi:hypothetical protein
MFYQTEAKLQAWRAVAVFTDRSECLIYVGRSTSQVRDGYGPAFLDILDDEEQSRVQSVALQCWHGAADRGYWVTKNTLPIPQPKPAGTAPPSKILPFRKPKETVEEEVATEAESLPQRLATTA